MAQSVRALNKRIKELEASKEMYQRLHEKEREKVIDLETQLARMKSDVSFLRQVVGNLTDVRSPIRQNINRNTGERLSEVVNAAEERGRVR